MSDAILTYSVSTRLINQLCRVTDW